MAPQKGTIAIISGEAMTAFSKVRMYLNSCIIGTVRRVRALGEERSRAVSLSNEVLARPCLKDAQIGRISLYGQEAWAV